MTAPTVPTRTRPPGPDGTQHLRAMRADPLGFVTGLAATYGDVTCHTTGQDTVYLVNRPDLARQVLKDNGSNYTKKHTPDDFMLRPLLGNGLLTSTGADWAAQRRMCAPAFRPGEVRAFDGVITDATAAMLRRWAPAVAAGTPLNLDHQLTSLTLSIVVRAILSVDVDGIGEGFGRAVDAVNGFIGHFSAEDDAGAVDVSDGLRRFTHAKQFLDLVTRTLIAARRSTGGGGPDLLGAMLAGPGDGHGHGPMSDADLLDQVLTLIMAGHETTAKALTWTFYLLDRHPSALDAITDEVDRVLGDRVPTAADHSSLVECQRAVKEAMRLYPPIWLTSRRAIGPDVLDGYDVAPGTLVCLSQWLLHRDPRSWDDPSAFRPERFAAATYPSHAYLPFGGGDRVCIGQHLAMIEATLALAMISQRVRLRLVDGFPVEPEALVTLRPRHGMSMVAVPR